MGSRTVRFRQSFYDNFHGLFMKDHVYKDIPDEVVLPNTGCEVIGQDEIDPEYDNVRAKRWEKQPDDQLVGVTRQKASEHARRQPKKKAAAKG
jgi:hypothetical protein